MQIEKFEKKTIKIFIIFLNKILELKSDYFFLTTNNYEYSIFPDHNKLFIPLINSKFKLFIDEKIENKFYNLNGILIFEKNIATFLINNNEKL